MVQLPVEKKGGYSNVGMVTNVFLLGGGERGGVYFSVSHSQEHSLLASHRHSITRSLLVILGSWRLTVWCTPELRLSSSFLLHRLVPNHIRRSNISCVIVFWYAFLKVLFSNYCIVTSELHVCKSFGLWICAWCFLDCVVEKWERCNMIGRFWLLKLCCSCSCRHFCFVLFKSMGIMKKRQIFALIPVFRHAPCSICMHAGCW